MIFRQLFDRSSSSYSYLVADTITRQARLIDPVLESVPLYQQLLAQLQLNLNYAIDTHVHADHITALGKLRTLYQCETVQGEQSKAVGISRSVADGDLIILGQLQLEAIYTPGHTDESYCFLLQNDPCDLLFSGDTLLIRATGRTDFQQGYAEAQYHSLFSKLLSLDEETRVYPGHDYRGMTVSTIGEEKRYNPHLKVSNQQQYCELMKAVNLAPPKKIAIAVLANLRLGV